MSRASTADPGSGHQKKLRLRPPRRRLTWSFSARPYDLGTLALSAEGELRSGGFPVAVSWDLVSWQAWGGCTPSPFWLCWRRAPLPWEITDYHTQQLPGPSPPPQRHPSRAGPDP